MLRRNAAEGFLTPFAPEARQQMEEEIRKLRDLHQNATRFRSDALLTFAEMMIRGARGDAEFAGKLEKWLEEWSGEADAQATIAE